MPAPRFDITAFLRMTEGQHFERKSLFKGEPDKKKPRDRKEVRDQIAECVAAFANAEGGVAIFGIEDDASVTGHKYPTNAIDEMLSVPSSRIQPPQANGFRLEHDGKELLVFEVAVADSPVMVTGNGYPLRVGDKTVKMEEPKIRALKLEGLAESWVNRPSPMTLADLNQSCPKFTWTPCERVSVSTKAAIRAWCVLSSILGSCAIRAKGSLDFSRRWKVCFCPHLTSNQQKACSE